LAALIYRESEAPEPIIPLRLFANRIFAVASLISLSMSMVMIAMIILVPLDFELGTGLAPNAAGVRLIPMTGGTVLGSFIVGRLVSRTVSGAVTARSERRRGAPRSPQFWEIDLCVISILHSNRRGWSASAGLR
jgi:hypothetical protein